MLKILNSIRQSRTKKQPCIHGKETLNPKLSILNSNQIASTSSEQSTLQPATISLLSRKASVIEAICKDSPLVVSNSVFQYYKSKIDNAENYTDKQIITIILEKIKDIIIKLEDQSCDDILNSTYQYYDSNSDITDISFYFNLLMNQNDTMLDVTFIKIIASKIKGKQLTDLQCDVLGNMAVMIIKKNLHNKTICFDVYSEIKKLINLLVKHNIYVATATVNKILILIKKYNCFTPNDINLTDISNELYEMIKADIEKLLIKNSCDDDEKKIFAKTISDIITQLQTDENKDLLIEYWLDNEELSIDFRNIFYEEITNIGLTKDKIENTSHKQEVFSSLNENCEQESISEKIKSKASVDDTASCNTLSFNNDVAIGTENDVTSYIDHLNGLDPEIVLDKLSKDFTIFISNQNDKSNIVNNLISSQDNELYILFIESIFKKTHNKRLTDDFCELLIKVIFEIHLNISSFEQPPIRVYGKMYQLVTCTVNNNVNYAVDLLNNMIHQNNKYDFELYCSSHEVYGSYLELLVTIFNKQQNEKTHKLYKKMENIISLNIKKRSHTSVEYKSHMATAIFNMYNLLREKEKKENFLKFWLGECDISATFKYILYSKLPKEDKKLSPVIPTNFFHHIPTLSKIAELENSDKIIIDDEESR